MNHRSGDCNNGYPTQKFVVDQKYIDSFKTAGKGKAVAAVFDRSRGRTTDHPCLCLFGDYRDCRSASPRNANASIRNTSRPRRSPSRRLSDRPLSSRRSRTVSPSPVRGQRSSSFEHIEPRSSPSPSAPHPVAAVLGSSSNAVAYMPSNEGNVLSSEDDEDEVSLNGDDVNSVHRAFVAAVVPSRPPSAVDSELKAPFHVEHLFWRCAVRCGGTDDVLVPVYDALLDDGAYAVLIYSSLVDELGLKRRKLPKPELVEGAMSSPGDPTQSTTLSEFVNLRLYCPVSSWAARTVRAIIAPLLCAPIILGLPFIVFNNVVVDAGLRTVTCKIDNHDLLNPVQHVSKVIKGQPPTESETRKAARMDAKVERAKERVLDHVWDRNAPAASPVNREVFWQAGTVRARDGLEVRVRALLNSETSANLISLETADHLGLIRSLLAEPIPYKCVLRGEDQTLSITEYVSLTLSSLSFEYTCKPVIALLMPEDCVLSAQVVLGAPFLSDNGVVIDNACGSVLVSACGTVLVCLSDVRDEMPAPEPKKLPRLSQERVTKRSTLAAVREQIEVLGAQQELADRGDKVKAEFPRLFDELPHGDDLLKDVYCHIKLKSAE